MAITTAPTSFVQRIIGAAALDAPVYEEIERDPRATAQAFVVVLLSSFAGGVGATGLVGPRGSDGLSVGSILFLSTLALIVWAAWALVTFEVGYRLLPQPQTRADPGQLLRTVGFATAPGLLRVFGIFPEATVPAFLVSSIWMIAAMVVAVRQALDYQSTSRAIAVCLVGVSLVLAVAAVLGLVFGHEVY
jgi:Yip1 domain